LISVLRAKVRQLSDIITSDIQPVQNLRVLNKHAGDEAAKKAEWARYWIENGFKGIVVCIDLLLKNV
jgi:DNA relaxase NicK